MANSLYRDCPSCGYKLCWMDQHFYDECPMCGGSTMAEHDDPDRHDVPRPTESQQLAKKAKFAFNRYSSHEKKLVEDAWNNRSEMEKQDIRDEVELDLL